MKITWEMNDITPNRRVRRDNREDVHLIVVKRKLGHSEIFLVNLTSGVVDASYEGMEAAAEALTQQGYVPA